MKSPIIPTSLDNSLNHGETDFGTMTGHGDNVRQLRKVAELLTDMVADCVTERRKGEAWEEHAHARVRADGHRELSRELVAMVARLGELEREEQQLLDEAQEEYETGRVWHMAQAAEHKRQGRMM